MRPGTRIPKPPSRGLIDAIAKAIDAWHATHPDLTVGEIIDAFRVVRNELAEAANRHNT